MLIKFKTIFLFVIVVFLLASTIYLGITIQDEENPTGTINSRASEDTEDSRTLAYRSTTTAPTKAVTPGLSPSPLVTVKISPTVPPKGGIVIATPTLLPTKTITPTKPVSPTPTFGNAYNTGSSIPTSTIAPVATAPTELPVAGITDTFNAIIMGAGALIIAAFIL
jgi:hypothetical protein